MKKRWLLLLAIVLILSACGGTTKDEPKDVSEKDTTAEEKENNEDKNDEEDALAENKEDEEDEEDQETTIEKSEGTEEDEKATTDEEDKENTTDTNSDTNSNDENEQQDDSKKEEEWTDEDIVEFAFSIFDAQVEEDYDYLESVLSKGSSLNKKKNTIQFDNVTYPHEYEFLPKKDIDFLDERYIKDSENDTLIVGFAVTDYDNESSYVVDTQLIKEDGKWKVNDIDINK